MWLFGEFDHHTAFKQLDPQLCWLWGNSTIILKCLDLQLCGRLKNHTILLSWEFPKIKGPLHRLIVNTPTKKTPSASGKLLGVPSRATKREAAIEGSIRATGEDLLKSQDSSKWRTRRDYMYLKDILHIHHLGILSTANLSWQLKNIPPVV